MRGGWIGEVLLVYFPAHGSRRVGTLSLRMASLMSPMKLSYHIEVPWWAKAPELPQVLGSFLVRSLLSLGILVTVDSISDCSRKGTYSSF